MLEFAEATARLSRLDRPKMYFSMMFFLVVILAALSLASALYSYSLSAGDIIEFRQHFRFYTEIYFSIFVLLSVALSAVYLWVLAKYTSLPMTGIMRLDIFTFLVFLFLFPYLFRIGDVNHAVNLSTIYLVSFLFGVAKIFISLFLTYQAGGLKLSMQLTLLILIPLSAAVLRVFLLTGPYANVSSDEAIMGLMARHIIFNREFPVFLYGQAHHGSLEALFAVPLFILFGASPLTLKIVPLIFSLIFVVLVYLLAKLLFSQTTALYAMLFVAIPGAFLTVYSILAITYIEAVTFGVAIVLMAFKIAKRSASQRKKLGPIALLGFLMGVAVWNNFMVAPWVLVSVLFLLITERRSLGGRELALGCSGFALGALPVIIFNLQHLGYSLKEHAYYNRYSSITAFATGVERVGPFLFKSILPSVVGTASAGALLRILIAVLVYVSIAYCILRSLQRPLEGTEREKTGLVVLLAIFGLTFISYLVTKSALSLTLRYAIGFIPLLTVFIAFAVSQIDRISRIVAVVIVGLIMIANMASTVQERAKPLMAQFGLSPKIATSLVNLLERKGVRYLYSDYWIAYQLTFFSKEKVISTPYPGFDRYPKYTQEVRAAYPKKVGYIYEKGSSSYAVFKERLGSLGVGYRQRRVGRNMIFIEVEKNVFGFGT